MFEYKSYLKLKIPKRVNILGLSWERYNVLSYDYDLWQDTNKGGEAISKIKGGNIRLALEGLPNDPLMAWVFDHAKFYNGEITIVDTEGETLEQIYFEEARCVNFDLHYGLDTQFKAETRLLLNVQRLQIGEAYFENTGE
ncbi:MAG: hypothetical protein LBT25_10350 [Candidatus Symbiothrix sp.]|jgi:hypothetical protein|nr:hypothetical protein [Candidatus Symbiothrix sp.]